MDSTLNSDFDEVMEDLRVLSPDLFCPLVPRDLTDSQLADMVNQPTLMEASGGTKFPLQLHTSTGLNM